MGDKLKTNLLVISLISCIVLLLGSISAIYFIDSKPIFVVETENTVSSPETSQINLQTEQTGVLIKTDNLDSVVEQLTSKGVSARKHKAGRVIAANVPNQILEELEQDTNIQILPNRMVQAFSVDGIEQINLESFSSEGITGNNIKIAVLDSGITNKDNIIAEQDFTASGTTNDMYNHGDKVYEVISAVSPNAKIINAKVLDNNGFGTEASIVAGINYAIEQNADVISISAGGLFDDLSSPMVSAVEDAVNQGIVVVVAAGNCGECGQCGTFKGVATPGNSPHAITVGAVNNDEAMCISPGKNYESYIKPDVVAPAQTTSISTPFVSSAAALILEKYSANPSQVKSIIENNAADLGAEGKDTVFGSGKLNLQLTSVDVPIVEEEIVLPETNYNNRPVVAFGTPTTRIGDWSEFTWPHLADNPPKTSLIDDNLGFIFWYGDIVKVSGMNWISEYSEDTFNHDYKSCWEEGSGFNEIETISNSEAYAAAFNRIKRYDGTTWNDETIPYILTTHHWYDWCTNGGAIYKTVDSNSGIVFAGGYNSTYSGVIIKKQSGTWTTETGIFSPIHFIKFLDSTNALAIGQKASGNKFDVSFYKWQSGTWTNTGSAVSDGKINSLETVSNSLAYAVGDNGTILKWNGVSWSNDAVGLVTADLKDLSFYDANNGFAVGSNSTILQYTSGTWSIYSQGESFISLSVSCGVNALDVVLFNTTFSDVKALSSSSGYLFGKGLFQSCSSPDVYPSYSIMFTLEPTAPFMNVPVIYVTEDATTSVDLLQYSNGDSFTVAPADSSKCSISGTDLNIDLADGFTGIATCDVTATRNSLNTIQRVVIESQPMLPLSDLSVSEISFTGPTSVSVVVNNVGRSSASNIDVKILDVKTGQEATYVISSLASESSDSRTVTVPFTVSRGSRVAVVVDYSNTIKESSESNNRAEKDYKKKDVYVSIIDIQTEFRTPIMNYLATELKEYNFVSSASEATDILTIGYNLGDASLGCSRGNVYANGNSETKPYSGLIFVSRESGKNSVNVCGARIEGIVAALRVLNKEDLSFNRQLFLGKDNTLALGTFTFMKSQPIVTSDLVERALYGGLDSSEKVVRTASGTWLRLRNYKPIVSKSFMDYLFAIDPTQSWLEPVVMAGGLWSDIDAWSEAGLEIASGVEDNFGANSINYAPRDVWLIELTGGPGTDCASCTDYTYDDIVDEYWPALIGGVAKFTNRYEMAYVGHSNGGRVGLDALSRHSSGMSNVGYLTDGTAFDLPANPVSTYIGVGVPGAFDEKTSFSDTLDDGNGARIVSEFSGIKQHITIADVGAESDTSLGWFVHLAKYWETTKISVNLLDAYVSFIDGTADTQPGNIVVNKATIISGNDGSNSDSVVPVSDEEAILNNINSADKEIKTVSAVHWAQTEDDSVKTIIKKRLNE